MARANGAARMTRRACVIGSGPNGLAAAIVLAQSGMRVDVLEAESQAGGAARTMELTLPGFRHDFGSAVHPLAVGSPFFQSLELEREGLEWIHSPSALAHSFDDGSTVLLDRDVEQTAAALGRDGNAWRRLMRPFAKRWGAFSKEILSPVHLFSRHPVLMARFGWQALLPASTRWRMLFREAPARALFAGIAAHSSLNLGDRLSASFGIVLGAAAHAVGWPIPKGGAQSITNALCSRLSRLGGSVKTSTRVEKIEDLGDYDLAIFDVTPKQLLNIAGTKLSEDYKHGLTSYRYGSGAFKVDYALANPIPWKTPECLRAATVHIGGFADEIFASEAAVSHGETSAQPFVLLSQPSLFDASRAPAGKHTAWAYCHVPNGSTVDMLPKIESQIERFAPGFRDSILARRVFSPAALQAMNANLVGGDINGGAFDIRQFVFRPTRHLYATSAPNIYLCSSSTPPGGGVHGMCGFHAASMALSRMKA
jgi:phytoene dehydrogenase-like protein